MFRFVAHHCGEMISYCPPPGFHPDLTCEQLSFTVQILLIISSVSGSLYLMWGIRSEIPVMPARMLPWEIMTPLGRPVDPLVYMITAMSAGSGCFRSRAAVG